MRQTKVTREGRMREEGWKGGRDDKYLGKSIEYRNEKSDIRDSLVIQISDTVNQFWRWHGCMYTDNNNNNNNNLTFIMRFGNAMQTQTRR